MKGKKPNLVKLLDIISSILLESPYIHFLQALISDRVAGEDTDFYKELDMAEVGDNFQNGVDGRIDRNHYETKKARFIQRLLSLSDEIYSNIKEVAEKESNTVESLWRNCNFKVLQVKQSNVLYDLVEEKMRENNEQEDTEDSRELKVPRDPFDAVKDMRHETMKRIFFKEPCPTKVNEYLLEALYLISLVGMYDLYILGCCIKKAREAPTNDAAEYINPTIEGMMVNPNMSYILNYISAVDLSKYFIRLKEDIKSFNDFLAYLNNIFSPFGLLLTEYENYITIKGKSKGRKMLKGFSYSYYPRHLGAGFEIATPGRNLYQQDVDSNDKDNNSQEYDPFNSNETSGQCEFITNGMGVDINQEIEKLTMELQKEFRIFPVFQALETYRLKGSPYNLVKYIRTCIEREFKKNAEKSEGLYSQRHKERFSISHRTLLRYRKEHWAKTKIDYSENREELTDQEIEIMSWQKDLNRKHHLEGYLSQNQLVKATTSLLNKNGIKCSETNVRNIFRDLRQKNLISATINGQGYYFKDETENLKNIFFLLKKTLEKSTSDN